MSGGAEVVPIRAGRVPSPGACQAVPGVSSGGGAALAAEVRGAVADAAEAAVVAHLAVRDLVGAWTDAAVTAEGVAVVADLEDAQARVAEAGAALRDADRIAELVELRAEVRGLRAEVARLRAGRGSADGRGE